MSDEVLQRRNDVSDKPTYLGLLNAIAVGEGRAHTYLRAWAEKTDNPDVRRVIETVAIREGEHALAFEKRICELGYSLRQREDESLEKTLALVTSNRSDLDKFESLGLGGDRKGGDRDSADPLLRGSAGVAGDSLNVDLKPVAAGRADGQLVGRAAVPIERQRRFAQ